LTSASAEGASEFYPASRVRPGDPAWPSAASWERLSPHYTRLFSIKKKYDPTGLFFTHHGVGSEEWSADGFTRAARR